MAKDEWQAVSDVQHALPARCEHIVQFYHGESHLTRAAGEYLDEGFRQHQALVVIATPDHCASFRTYLRSRGIDLARAEAAGQVVWLDADATLGAFMVDGMPDADRFHRLVGAVIERGANSPFGPVVRAYGEMVALLCERQNTAGAAELERLWNELANHHRFTLYCSYPIGLFGEHAHGDAFREICTLHSAVVPVEDWTQLEDEGSRRRRVAELQQRSAALEAEIAARKEADRRKDEFLAMLGHELRNPLAPIRSAAEVLRALVPENTEVQEASGIIERQVEHLARLVDDLLDVSRISRGRIRLQKQPTDVATVIWRAVETTQPLISARRHRLHVELPSASVMVDGDATRLAQAVGNLLSNAAKYTPEGGDITISCARVGTQVEVAVRDNGLGMAPETLARVFDLFTQAERSLDRSEGGLGIGLSLARSLIEMHAGTIEARSDGLGRGSELVVRLPALATSPHGTRQTTELTRRSFRMLLVDDNADSANMLKALLALSGHDVTAVYSAHEALQMAPELQPAILFLDIGLPGMNGYELARALRSHPSLSGAVMIAMTGYGSAEDREHSRNAGFDFHLVKPLDPNALEQTLRQIQG